MRNRGLGYDIVIHAHGIFQSHPPSVILSCPPHTLTDPLPHPHPLSCLSYDRMDFMKAALTSKGKDLFAGA